MDSENTDVKKRILDVTVRLLQEGREASKITIRQIATEANANIALINYYFQSKENLLNKAVEVCMTDLAGRMFEKDAEKDDPVERLRHMIRNISDFAFNNYYLSEIAISDELKHGSLSTTQMILPVLDDVFGGRRSESELRLMALQLIVPLQVMFLNAGEYKRVLAKDLFDETQRNELLDKMIDTILKGRN